MQNSGSIVTPWEVKGEVDYDELIRQFGVEPLTDDLIGRLKSRFNISISEVDYQDDKTSAVVGIAVVSNDSRFINQQFDSIIDFMRGDGRFYLGTVERETF